MYARITCKRNNETDFDFRFLTFRERVLIRPLPAILPPPVVAVYGYTWNRYRRRGDRGGGHFGRTRIFVSNVSPSPPPVRRNDERFWNTRDGFRRRSGAIISTSYTHRGAPHSAVKHDALSRVRLAERRSVNGTWIEITYPHPSLEVRRIFVRIELWRERVR